MRPDDIADAPWEVLRVEARSLDALLAGEPLPAGATLEDDLVRLALRVAVGASEADAPATATSVRLPADVHDAARQAVDAGWGSSLTALVVAGLRQRLGTLASGAIDEAVLAETRAALDAHYAVHPEARPPLAMVVQSAAELEDHPAAHRPDLIERAVADLGEDAYVEDVLAWVRGVAAEEVRAS